MATKATWPCKQRLVGVNVALDFIILVSVFSPRVSAVLAWVVMTTSFSFSVGEFSVMGVTSGEGEWTKTLGFSRIEVPAEDAERESKHLLSSFVAEWPGLLISNLLRNSH